MNSKRILITIISVLLILGISDIIYLTAFNLSAFNENFHKKEFKKYNIYSEFPGKDVDAINSELLLYLKGRKDNYNKELFNEEETTHLKDVRAIIQRLYISYYSILIVSILLIAALFFLNQKDFSRNLTVVLFFSGILTLFIAVIVLVLVILNFDGFFTAFHHIFFPKGGWLFASSDSIIKLYPPEFFYDTAKRIFISIVIYANILILTAISIFSYRKWISQQ